MLKRIRHCFEEKTLQGESQERWGMKKGPKVFDTASRQNGNQTVNSERAGNEASFRSQDPVENQYAVETGTS